MRHDAASPVGCSTPLQYRFKRAPLQCSRAHLSFLESLLRQKEATFNWNDTSCCLATPLLLVPHRTCKPARGLVHIFIDAARDPGTLEGTSSRSDVRPTLHHLHHRDAPAAAKCSHDVPPFCNVIQESNPLCFLLLRLRPPPAPGPGSTRYSTVECTLFLHALLAAQTPAN